MFVDFALRFGMRAIKLQWIKVRLLYCLVLAKINLHTKLNCLAPPVSIIGPGLQSLKIGHVNERDISGGNFSCLDWHLM